MKKKLPANYCQIKDGFISYHYVTHDKNPSKVIISIKNDSKNSVYVRSMLAQLKNQGVLFVNA